MTDLLTPIRSEHTCEGCSGSFMPVSHPATTAAEAAPEQSVPASAAVDLAALRNLIWYRGDLAGELVTT